MTDERRQEAERNVRLCFLKPALKDVKDNYAEQDEVRRCSSHPASSLYPTSLQNPSILAQSSSISWYLYIRRRE